MNIVGKKNLFFLISILVVIPGLISLFLYGLNLSIDFTGGSRLSLFFPKEVSQSTIDIIKKEITTQGVEVATIQKSKERLFIRTTPIDQSKHEKIIQSLEKQIGDFKEENFETIGPVIGEETTSNAIKSVIIASFLIMIYIAWSFRKVPHPASSWRFGVCTIIALIHDVLVVLGVFSLLGHFYNVEIDSLFVTALLTIIGFSVHDTIVVFDRIRENLKRMSTEPFSQVVNESIIQTMGRSLNTSLTVILVLLGMVLFGGESIRWFVIALLVGIISGTYSSIFNAAPLLTVWEEWSRKRIKK